MLGEIRQVNGLAARDAVRRGTAFALALALAGCGGVREADIAVLAGSSDQEIWEAAQEAVADGSWSAARQYFRRIVDGFPQSQYGPGARIGLADSFYQEGGHANQILAVAAYREFLTFYPSHPRSAYALFMLAESQFAQRHGPDRDQTPTRLALDEYNRLMELHPNSPYLETARARIRACRQSLAESEYLAGYFYQRTRNAYRAAIARYEIVLDQYPDYEKVDMVLYRLGQALVSSRRLAEAIPYLNRLIELYPDSEYVDDAQDQLAKIPLDAVPAAAEAQLQQPQTEPPQLEPPPSEPLDTDPPQKDTPPEKRPQGSSDT